MFTFYLTSRAGLNVTSRWPDTSDFHSPISPLVPRPKFMTPDPDRLLKISNRKPRLFTVPYFFVRSFGYTASYRHGYLDFLTEK